jgi:hypothetical protein
MQALRHRETAASVESVPHHKTNDTDDRTDPEIALNEWYTAQNVNVEVVKVEPRRVSQRSRTYTVQMQ